MCCSRDAASREAAEKQQREAAEKQQREAERIRQQREELRQEEERKKQQQAVSQHFAESMRRMHQKVSECSAWEESSVMLVFGVRQFYRPSEAERSHSAIGLFAGHKWVYIYRSGYVVKAFWPFRACFGFVFLSASPAKILPLLILLYSQYPTAATGRNCSDKYVPLTIPLFSRR